MNLFHRDKINKMRKNLEEDLWVAADIPFEFYEIFFFIFGLK